MPFDAPRTAACDQRWPTICFRARGSARSPGSNHMETPSPYTMFGVKASAKAAPLRRRPRSPMPSTTRCGRSGLNSCTRRSRRAGWSRPFSRRVPRKERLHESGSRFAYERPSDLKRRTWPDGQDGRRYQIIAGGQSLGPMLNLRLVEPDLIVDITGLSELKQAGRSGDELVIGALRHPWRHRGWANTRRHPRRHAAGLPVTSPIGRSAIAARSADRSVMPIPRRTGFRLCRRWEQRSRCAALKGFVHLAIEDFVTGRAGIRAAARRDRRGRAGAGHGRPSARWGYVKACRKKGEFAHAIAAVLIDPEAATARAVIGALDAVPVVLGDGRGAFWRAGGAATSSAIRSASSRCDPDQGGRR